jgi:lysozyme family protein
MAADNFPFCLMVTLHEEGGFVHDAADPGGATKYGITQAVWEAWVGHAVTENDMRDLTVPQVTPLYRAQYWQAASCDKLPGALAMCVFDFAVNGGVGRAAMTLQRMVGAAVDGHIGVNTLLSVQQHVRAESAQQAVKEYQTERAAFYHQCKNFDRFGRGWLARVDRITAQALEMA